MLPIPIVKVTTACLGAILVFGVRSQMSSRWFDTFNPLYLEDKHRHTSVISHKEVVSSSLDASYFLRILEFSLKLTS